MAPDGFPVRITSLLPIADLYARSVAYIPKAGKQFTGYKGEPIADRIYLWNFLVDCFEGSDENFRTNIRCETYRCPQYVTNNLVALSPESWLGRLLIRLRLLGNKGGEPAPSPRYDRTLRQKGNISYTPLEIQENLYIKALGDEPPSKCLQSRSAQDPGPLIFCWLMAIPWETSGPSKNPTDILALS